MINGINGGGGDFLYIFYDGYFSQQHQIHTKVVIDINRYCFKMTGFSSHRETLSMSNFDL